MRGSIRVLMLAGGLAAAGASALSAQTPSPQPPPTPAPAGGLNRVVVSPEYAQSINRIFPQSAWNQLFGPDIGATVRTFGARLELRPSWLVAPFVATALVSESGTSSLTAALVSGGVRADFFRAPEGVRVVPYVVAAAGMLAVGDEAGRFVPSAGVGARLVHVGDLTPHLELRYERYSAHDYAMLGLGINLLFTHRGTVALD